jgi:flagellar motor switch protein FliN/FliY
MADDNLMSQDEIERLLNQPKGAGTPAATAQNAPSATSPTGLNQNEIESLLKTDPSKSKSAYSPQAPQSPHTAEAKLDPRNEQLLAQADIETLLAQSGRKNPAAPSKPVAEVPAAHGIDPSDDSPVAPADVEFLLSQAEQALRSIDAPQDGNVPQGILQFRLEEFPGAPASSDNATLDLIRDVDLDLKIELGRTHMYLEDVLRLRKGSVVPLDKLAGDPVDIYVNGRLIARGEVLVLNDNFCVRVAELITSAMAHD